MHFYQRASTMRVMIMPPTEIPQIDWAISTFLIALADVCSSAVLINVSVLFRERLGWVIPHKSQSAFAGTRQIGHLNSDCVPRIEANRVLDSHMSSEDNRTNCEGPTIPHNLRRVSQLSTGQVDGLPGRH